MKNKKLFVSHKETKAQILNTPAKRRAYKKDFEQFVRENRRAILKELGEQVKKARATSGVTQEALAKKLNTTRSAISRIEAGDQNLTVGYIIKAAIALGRPFEVKIY